MGHIKNGGTYSSVNDKFGRVFVLNNNKEYELVEGAKFSNIQLRVFCGDKEDDTFKGRSYSLGLLGNRFRAPIPLGMNVLADTKNVDLAYEREMEIVKQLKLISEEDDPDEYRRKCKIVEESRMSLFWTLTSPNRDILEQDFLLKSGSFAYIDDLLESLGGVVDNGDGKIILPENKKTKLPYELTSRLSGHLCHAILENVDDEEVDPFADMLKDPSKIFRKVLGYDEDNEQPIEQIMEATNDKLVDFYSWVHFILGFISFLRTEALKTAKKNGCSAKDFLHHVAEVMDVFCLEFSQEWYTQILSTGSRRHSMVPSIVTMRKQTAGGILFLETILLQNGMDIDEELRRNSMFKLILDQVQTHFQKVNELVSFDKEMVGKGHEWRNNEACMLHKIHGLSISEAKVQMAKDANQALKQIERMSECLLGLDKGPKANESFIKFTKVVNEIITGHMQWSLLVNRYHTGATIDCYID